MSCRMICILVLIMGLVAGGCGEAPQYAPPPVAKDGACVAGTLAREWEVIQREADLQGEVLTNQFQVTLWPKTGEIRSLTAQAVVERGDDVLVYNIRKENGEHKGTFIDLVLLGHPLDAQNYVPVAAVMEELDALGMPALALPRGEYTCLELVVQPEEGRVFGGDPNRAVYLADGGRTRKLTAQQTWVVEDAVLVNVWAVGTPLEGEPDERKRAYVLSALSGTNQSVDFVDPLLPAGAVVQDRRVFDHDGDGSVEQVTMVGVPENPDAVPFCRERFMLVGSSGDKVKTVAIPPGEGFYGTQYAIRDVTGDGRPEVLVYDHAGGSAGVVILGVYSFEPEGLREVFGASPFGGVTLDLGYLGQGRVRVAVKPFGPVWEYAVNHYAAMPDEELKQSLRSGWADPFSQYDIVDLNGDGKPEIYGWQALCGQAHADVIGVLRQAFVLEDGGFVPGWTDLYRFTGQGMEKVIPMS